MNKILIIEDDADIARSLTIRLAHYGYEVFTAVDGVLAMTEVRKVKPDVVLLDINLPGANGFKIAGRIRDVPELAATPLIFITASKRPEFRALARQVGAVGYFEKPYDAGELLERVRDAIDMRKQQSA